MYAKLRNYIVLIISYFWFRDVIQRSNQLDCLIKELAFY
jgi:hypothetical protein